VRNACLPVAIATIPATEREELASCRSQRSAAAQVVDKLGEGEKGGEEEEGVMGDEAWSPRDGLPRTRCWRTATAWRLKLASP